MRPDRRKASLDALKTGKNLTKYKRYYLHRILVTSDDYVTNLKQENVRLQQAVAILERNNARIEACVAMSANDGRDPRTIAKVKGWDCFSGERP